MRQAGFKLLCYQDSKKTVVHNGHKVSTHAAKVHLFLLQSFQKQ